MWLSSDNTVRAWLKKVKSDGARAKWLSGTTARYYTLDFNTQTFYYSHSEALKDVSQPVRFSDIIGAQEIPPSPGQGRQGGARGFILRTCRRTYELYTITDPPAHAWVQALNTARDIGRDAHQPGRPQALQGVGAATTPLARGCHASPAGERKLDLDEATCRSFLRTVPCEVRSAAASRYPEWKWTAMTWYERVVAVQGYCGSSEDLAGFVRKQTAAAEATGLRHRVVSQARGPGAGPPVSSGAGAGAGGRDPCREGHTAAARPPQLPALRQSPSGEFSGGQLHPPPPPPPEAQPLRGIAATPPASGPLDAVAPAGHAPQPAGAAGQRARTLERQRLRTIFDTSDGLQLLVGHHLDALVDPIVEAMRLRTVPPGEILIRQGWESRSMYVVDEGAFDVWLERSQGPSLKVCQYGPGTVFGERAMVSSAPRPATVVAASPARVWALERECFQALLKAPDSMKTIGFVGGVMLLINSLAGPTIVSMPALAQEAGWLSVLLVQALVAAFAAACGYMLIEAMACMPGNGNFEQRIEFTNLAMFYLPRSAYVLVMSCYHINSILTLMSLIIQSGQVIDYVILNVCGCAPGLALGGGELGYVCGTRTDSVTPFGDSTVLSSSMAVVALVCAPFAVKNLDDNVVLQYLAIAGLSVMSCIWVSLLAAEPDFPVALPAATSSQGPLIGTVLFNFAFASALPSWVNEKRSDVSVAATFGMTMVYVVVVYATVGIVGGMAYKPFYTTDQNLFSKLNAGGSRLGQATVTAYPMLQNFTSIPVFSILIRYNLLQSGMLPGAATFIAVGLPWVMSIPFYTGRGFEAIAEYGGLATSSVINFIVPVVFYFCAQGQQRLQRS